MTKLFSHKRVGGLHFVRIGNLAIQFSKRKSRNSSRHYDSLVREAISREWELDRVVTRIEDTVSASADGFATWFTVLLITSCAWTIALTRIDSETWLSLADTLFSFIK